jgi:hypothetical protein
VVREPRKFFDGPRLIMCEGRADAAVLRELVKQRELPEYQIRTSEDAGASGGIDSFHRLLDAIRTWSGFEKLQQLSIVADADDDPHGNFQRVRRQVEAAKIYPVPTEPLVEAFPQEGAGVPSVRIVILPSAGEQGCLETLCLSAALSISAPYAACVEAFAACADVETWPRVAKRHQMKLTALLAVSHPKNPAIGLGNVWRDARHLIPLDHAVFDALSDILAR